MFAKTDPGNLISSDVIKIAKKKHSVLKKFVLNVKGKVMENSEKDLNNEIHSIY